jgi:glycerol-3-phosphate dehydrogenase
VTVAEIAQCKPEWNERLIATQPLIEAEIVHAVRNEYAITLADVLARRLRLSFTDIAAADRISARVADIMAAELKWSRAQKNQELAKWKEYSRSTMGGELLVDANK